MSHYNIMYCLLQMLFLFLIVVPITMFNTGQARELSTEELTPYEQADRTTPEPSAIGTLDHRFGPLRKTKSESG